MLASGHAHRSYSNLIRMTWNMVVGTGAGILPEYRVIWCWKARRCAWVVACMYVLEDNQMLILDVSLTLMAFSTSSKGYRSVLCTKYKLSPCPACPASTWKGLLQSPELLILVLHYETSGRRIITRYNKQEQRSEHVKIAAFSGPIAAVVEYDTKCAYTVRTGIEDLYDSFAFVT